MGEFGHKENIANLKKGLETFDDKTPGQFREWSEPTAVILSVSSATSIRRRR